MDLKRFIEDQLADSAYVKLLLLQKQAAMIEAIGRKLAATLKGGRRV